MLNLTAYAIESSEITITYTIILASLSCTSVHDQFMIKQRQ